MGRRQRELYFISHNIYTILNEKDTTMNIDDLINDEGDLQIDPHFLETDLASVDQVMPEKLHIIPVRYRPIFPGIITPLIISQERFCESIDMALDSSRVIGISLLKDDDAEDIESEDLHIYGSAAKVLKKINLPDGGINVLINSIKRFRIKNVTEESPHIIADVEYLEEKASNRNIEIKALTRAVLSQLKILSENNPLFTEEMKLTMVNVDEPGKIADFVTSILNLEKHEYQDILETINIKKRLEKVLHLLYKEIEVLSVQKKIQNNINDKIDRQQRDFFLREQLRAIKSELGIDEDERSREIRDMTEKVTALQLKGEAKEKMDEELQKLQIMDPNTSEYTLTRNYVDTVISLPWNERTENPIDIDQAEKILDKDHYGLEDVKKRIIEFLAVRKLKADNTGSIICLVGPPGVGKTSLGQSIARAMNRKFFRMSLGGMRDEAEIKGHRRTYIGAMPGKIIQGLKISKSVNPVFMLDEIDKLGQSFQGDPAAALLEVLDPEQNAAFRDHYLDMPFDLSDVFFITTANTLDSIPRVLIDRMEVIRLSGYIAEEKYQIARKYLLPKQVKKHGLKRSAIKIDKKGFHYIIDGWAREAGVRNLERSIQKICRKSATLTAREKKLPEGTLNTSQIRTYLGPEVYTEEDIPRTLKPGLAVGLAWTELGGAILLIEAIEVESGKGPQLKLTGQLGEVMSESANIAFSYVQHYLSGDKESVDFFLKNALHIHVPAGATPKDGPSAGITMATALYSLITRTTMKSGYTLTGELTLSGRVLPVGGIKEKIIAAKRASLKNIIIPVENQKDLQEIPDYVKKGLHFHPVKDMNEVFSTVFPVKRR